MNSSRRSSFALVCAVASLLASSIGAKAEGPAATPRATCRADDKPEPGLQGRVSAEAIARGDVANEGYHCNMDEIGRFGSTLFTGGAGGYKVHRYVDAVGHECAYYDSTLLVALNVPKPATDLPGVIVLDMSDPANPRKTANLVTPAMLSPHESLSISHTAGLLAAVAGTPATAPGIVDVYDISADCRHPVLQSSTPLAILGHEGNFSPDGKTFWATSTAFQVVTAVDVSNPKVPTIVWSVRDRNFHGITISEDGNRLYAAELGSPAGLTILDVSQVQARVPNPQVRQVSRITWPNVSIPQNAIPITIGGHPYVVEVDEFARGTAAGDPSAPVGAARIIDIADETAPTVVSDLRLEVHQPENIDAINEDPNSTFLVAGYAGHYCAVPRRHDPGIVACSFILSGLRVFDIRNPSSPREIGYFNVPIPPPSATNVPGGSGGSFTPHSAYAMSAPAFDPETGDVWYTDGSRGFYNVRLASDAWPAFAA